MKQYKIILKNFNALYANNQDFNSVIDILEKPVLDITLGILNILEKNKIIVIKKNKEINTLNGSLWPKERIKKYIAVEKNLEFIGNNKYYFSDISLRYDYFNPRDGDGWKVETSFKNPYNNNKYDFYFQKHSHYTQKKLCMGVHILEDEYLIKIQQFLNNYFNENVYFEEDIF